MKRDQKTSRRSVGDIKGFLALFAKQESGQMTVFAVYLILIMLIIGGTGVDLMHNEMERTRMQAVADRAVLAAADLDQKRDPELVVRDYFAKSGMADFVKSVKVSPGANTPGENHRTVEVNAATNTNTQFMKTLGVPTLKVPARAIAEEKVNKVEVSLVLDISGSMDDNSKMTNLHTAAGSFVETLLKPANKNLISVSMIPYSQHVNVGEDIFNLLNVNQLHNYSHCIEFNESDFGTVSFDRLRTYQHMQHFQWNTYSIQSGYTQNTRYDTMCPRYSYETIIPFSQDAEELKREIKKLKPRAGTQIFLGMKWATALLDPSFQPLTAKLNTASKVDTAFKLRPASYADKDTVKTIVLMTDGKNSSATRIASRYYNSDSEIVHWNRYNFNYYLSRAVNESYHYRYYWTKYTESTGDRLLKSMCDAAKKKNVVIWSIGFEVDTHGADVMRNCASSPSHFFKVEGVNITDAFEAIARQINQLRLTQ